MKGRVGRTTNPGSGGRDARAGDVGWDAAHQLPGMRGAASTGAASALCHAQAAVQPSISCLLQPVDGQPEAAWASHISVPFWSDSLPACSAVLSEDLPALPPPPSEVVHATQPLRQGVASGGFTEGRSVLPGGGRSGQGWGGGGQGGATAHGCSVRKGVAIDRQLG